MAQAMQTERLAVLAADWFPGEAAAVGQAREFVRGVLGNAWPRLDDVLLMVSEVASNAVRHTASGDDGGWFDLTVSATGVAVRIAIADRGGSSEPAHTGRRRGAGRADRRAGAADRGCPGGQVGPCGR